MRSSMRRSAFWTSVSARAQDAVAHAATPRGVLVASAIAMFGVASIPIVAPTSAYALRLAEGDGAIELDRDDAFATHVRAVAARVGVQHTERLSVRVSDYAAGASLGANVSISRCGACIVLPTELYDAFYATPAESAAAELPSRDEVDFVLAHESAHIADNHAVAVAAFLPLSMLASCVLATRLLASRVPFAALAASVAGCTALFASNTLLSWRVEHAADHTAAAVGHAHGGICCFNRRLARNCELLASDALLITTDGNYLGDAAHPLLTWRVRHLERLVGAATETELAASAVASTGVTAVAAADVGAGGFGARCRYCFTLG